MLEAQQPPNSLELASGSISRLQDGAHRPSRDGSKQGEVKLEEKHRFPATGLVGHKERLGKLIDECCHELLKQGATNIRRVAACVMS